MEEIQSGYFDSDRAIIQLKNNRAFYLNINTLKAN